MGTVLESTLTVADLLEQLGGIDPARVRMDPPLGKATEKDLLRIHRREDRLYELVDGVLVEKIMGYLEGSLAATLIRLMGPWIEERDLGNLSAPDSPMRLLPRVVRLPDIAFISWQRLGKHELPEEPIPDLAPELAIEILSTGNTRKEMERKLREYFQSGVILVWFIDPATRTVEVFTAPDQSIRLNEDQVLDGGEVLPGFTLPIQKIFARVPRKAPSKSKRKSRSRKKREEQ